MPDNNMTIEMAAVMQLLKSYNDLSKTKTCVEMALKHAYKVQGDISFEQDYSLDSSAWERMEASSITIDKVIKELEHAKTMLNGETI